MKIVILDRDGVINHDSDAYVKNVDEWLPIPNSCEAIAKLRNNGFKVYIATNQSGLGRGYFSQTELDEMHQKMTSLVAKAGGEITGIFYCPHAPEDNCDCRKPLPGLFSQIREHSNVDLAGAPIIGDSIRDLEAGVAAGCTPILVRTGKGENSETKLAQHDNVLIQQATVFNNLAEAAEEIIKQAQ